MSALSPFSRVRDVMPQSENEPGARDRVLVGYGKDGSARYWRVAFGKIGEEFVGWMTNFNEMVHRKESTLLRPLMETYNNNKGFNGSDRQVYDPDGNAVQIAGAIAQHFLESQVPIESIKGVGALAQGRLSWNDMQAVHTLAPLVGAQISKGFPGGPEVGEVAAERHRHLMEVNRVSADIREALANDDRDRADKLMDEAHMTTAERRMYFQRASRPGVSPHALRQFRHTAPPEEQERLDVMRGR